MPLNDFGLWGEDSDGNVITKVNEGNYLYPNGSIKFNHTFTGTVAVFIQTSPTTDLQLWSGLFTFNAGTTYSLRDDIFSYVIRWYCNLVGERKLKLLISDPSPVNEWYFETYVDCDGALPDISSYYLEVIPNFTRNNETFLVEVRVYDMDADSKVFFVVDGKSFLMETTDNLNYTLEVDASLLSVFLLKKISFIAINSYGIDVGPPSDDFEWMGNVLYSSGIIDFQSWPDSASIANWTEVGSVLQYYGGNYMIYCSIPMDETEEAYWAKTIDELISSSPFRFQLEFGTSNSMDETGEEIYIGAFGELADPLVMENFMGLRLWVDGTPEQRLSVVIIDDDGNETSVDFAELLEDWSISDTIYSVVGQWNPITKKFEVSLYKTTPTLEASFLETVEIDASLVPEITMSHWGIHGAYSGVAIHYGRIYLGNIMLHVGEEDEIPRMVDELEVKTAYKPTDMQILSHYYDFDTGEDVLADDNLTIEIYDRDEVLVTTLTSYKRTDNWYEAYWDTASVDKGTYKIKAIATFSGRQKATEKLVSVQNG